MKLTYVHQSGSPPVGDGGDQYTGLDRWVVNQRRMKVSTGTDLERVQYGFDRVSAIGMAQDDIAAWDPKFQERSIGLNYVVDAFTQMKV